MKEKLTNILYLMLDELINAIVVGSKAIFILIFGIWLAYFIAGRVRKILLRTLKDEMLSNFLSKLAFVGIMVMAVVVTLGTMGVQTTSIIAALGAAGLAIALALKDSLSNLASGIMLVVFRPFTKSDTIEVNGKIGIVEDISLFHTYMKMPDGKLIITPNTNIATSEVINYTTMHAKRIQAKNEEIISNKEVVRRIDWLVGVSYTSDIDKVKDIIYKAVVNTENINNGKEDTSKKIFIGVNELQSSSIEFAVRAWVIDNGLFFSTKCNMIENVKKALDSNNIEIPYNKLDVNLIK
ncbi:mechanosensitive ion channel family protein [Helicobacter sp. MIT 14-3879]|uniref:mechanosensitive ion channel family protein n=1 Tax=Helicobacter sp. MIT 14-3879 TaxID=2040649 RepID=UPI000E1FA2E7|nr:mechanosensitive ion channel domain-containing protein [Helicobacter sp. MIT 14-3879]RDU63125.1 mechanosensitive ion channel protein [Helicobacter sp. MIT 14-3879]